ncbi:hypothetical protein BUALT_Bualt06G0082800 [Buddleja alternifolia]|uniref:Histone-lysine N-methyltransferase n=1 Tax=Buddleja alternifolia TaxID=168488 RepID=A0AAV6XKM5_9LAMI|nr:hypothetical protein BUALT_Bualt06G0082800 [Buddleja alternifolia]
MPPPPRHDGAYIRAHSSLSRNQDAKLLNLRVQRAMGEAEGEQRQTLLLQFAMSLMADTSHHPTMPGKRLLENGYRRKFPSNFKRPWKYASRDFPVKLGAISRDNYPTKRRKVAATRDFPNNCGPLASGRNAGDVDPGLSDRAKYLPSIPAVPLRSLPSIDVKLDPEKSLALDGKDVDVGQQMANENENSVCSFYEKWKQDSEKLAAVIAQAKECINLFDIKFSINALDENLLEKRLKVEDTVSKMVHEGQISGLESKLEDDKDENCSLSPIDPEKLSVEGNKNVDLDLDQCAFEGEEGKLTIYVPESNRNHEELINLKIVQHDQPRRFKIMEALKLFEVQYKELMQEHELRGDVNATPYAHVEAAMRLRSEGMWVCVEKPFGHIPGVKIGDEFGFRAELAVIGLHRQLVSGIDDVVLDGKKFATSVVNAGRYENNDRELDVLIYSGQGGNRRIADKAGDQKLEKGNLALMNSMEMGYPVRVTYKRKGVKAANTLGMSNAGNFVYVYDGLYTVNKFWHERDQKGNLVFKFELHRMTDQPRPHQAVGNSRIPITCKEICVMDDISKGKENLPIRAMNGVDDDKPPPFTYTTNIVYPYWYQPIEPIGCNCVNGCSDMLQCPCVLKNGGEIPFTEKGAIIKAKRKVHECGPSCKCPPSCMNRVSQTGPRHQLEIFKTESRGWGIRSRNFISSGSFICEYVGELLRDKEAELRVGDDEYLFDIYDDGYVIDAAMYGNIGRFINHSCSPNLYGQEILYDHDDKRMPHIMFFATKNIPPLEELVYDYNYKMNRICDANGNIKTKACYCGSRKCTGRMY